MAELEDLETGFHAHGGWFFKRLGEGTVRVVGPDSSGAVQVVTFDAATWASIVASVSAPGETTETFYGVLNFHNGVPYSKDAAAAIRAADDPR